MKKLIALTIAAIVGNTMLAAVAHAQAEQSSLVLKDSCSWVQKVDSIKVDFAITVDSNGFVRKQKADLLVRRYEAEQCRYMMTFYKPVQNEVFMLNGVPVEVLMYKPKGQQMLVGNSR